MFRTPQTEKLLKARDVPNKLCNFSKVHFEELSGRDNFGKKKYKIPKQNQNTNSSLAAFANFDFRLVFDDSDNITKMLVTLRLV